MKHSSARYALAFLSVGVGCLLRLALHDVLGYNLAYVTFSPAVMVAATLGGFRVGVLSTVLSLLVVEYYLIKPLNVISAGDTGATVGMILFCATGVFMSAVAGLYHKAVARAAEYETELALCDTEKKYEELVQNANSAILRWRNDGTVSFFNEYAQKFFGYADEEIIGKSVSVLVPEVETTGNDLSRLIQQITDHPEQFAHNTNENVTKDGRRIWMAWANRPLFDTQGRLSEILAIGTDITDRKRAEDSLREREEHLGLFIAYAPAALAIFDTQMRYIAASNRWISDFGLIDREIIGHSHYDIIPDLPDRWKEIHKRCLAGAVERAQEDRFERADGTIQWLKWEVRPWRGADDSVGGIIIFSEDISEQKQADEHLRGLVQRLNSHMDNSPLAVIEWDTDYRVVRWSNEAQRLFGWTSQEIMGKRIDEMRWVYEDDWPTVAELMDNMDAGMHPSNVSPNRNYTKNGSVVFCEWYNSAIRDASGNVTSVLSLVLDVTGRVSAQQALLASEAQKGDFYRRTILAATNGKLAICEKPDIYEIGIDELGSWDIVDMKDVATVRNEVSAFGRSTGMADDRVTDFKGCVVEAAGNAWKHAGSGHASLHRTAEGLLLIVTDSGPGIGAMAIPDVALTRGYSTAGTLGMGYKLIINFADQVYLASGPNGTTVGIEIKFVKPADDTTNITAIKAW